MCMHNKSQITRHNLKSIRVHLVPGSKMYIILFILIKHSDLLTGYKILQHF